MERPQEAVLFLAKKKIKLMQIGICLIALKIKLGEKLKTI